MPTDTLPARLWVQMQRSRPDGPLQAMNVTEDPGRAEEWRQFGREVAEYAPAGADSLTDRAALLPAVEQAKFAAAFAEQARQSAVMELVQTARRLAPGATELIIDLSVTGDRAMQVVHVDGSGRGDLHMLCAAITEQVGSETLELVVDLVQGEFDGVHVTLGESPQVRGGRVYPD